MTSADGFEQAFAQCSALLQQYRQYWQLLPFAQQQLPWQNTALAHTLMALPAAELEQIDQSPALQQQHFAQHFDGLFELEGYYQAASAQSGASAPFWLTNGIGGRKLAQISAFAAHLPDSPWPMLEWCAGKGHLGRLLAWQRQQPVISVEWQAALCEQGTELAAKFQLPQRFIQADVLSAQGRAVLAPSQQVLALHACGQLHISLLQQATELKCQQLHLVPCCYHLIADDGYQPLSELGQQQNLGLSRHDLKLAVQGQVTAGARVEKLRHLEVHWRLAYQALRAELSGNSQYQPLASVSKHWFSGDFADFCHWAASQHQLRLPADIDFTRYLAAGAQQALLVQRIELVRHLFRRPLELWLVLDRALFLQQHGYSVTLNAFCDYQLTPRNLMLSACR